MNDALGLEYSLIVTIVNKGNAKKVVEVSKKTGASGGTTLLGRGTGIHEGHKLFGICIDPEKEVVLTLVEKNRVDAVLSAIVARGKLDQPGFGIAFVMDTKTITGIAHLLKNKGGIM